MTDGLQARFDAALREAGLAPDPRDRAAAEDVAATLDRSVELLRAYVKDAALDATD